MPELYIDIMIQSLEKKVQVLDEIIRLDDLQKDQLEQPDALVEDFDKTVEDKAALIEQLEKLDSGFDKIYTRVKEELHTNKEAYREQIKKMQELIRSITDKSMQIQAQEARNKDLMTQKFARVRRQVRDVRANGKATTEYYKSMMQVNYIDPQFMDNKK